jgi:curved DNA-binding protein CbpA
MNILYKRIYKTNKINIILNTISKSFHKDIDFSKDYYKSLGISKSATEQEIKTAYRKLAKQYHPDINKTPSASEKFKEVTSAYEVLSDKDKKSTYDSGSSGGGQGFNGFNGFNGFKGFNGFDGFKGFDFKQTSNKTNSSTSNSSSNKKSDNNFYSNFNNFTNNQDASNHQYKRSFTFKDPKTGEYRTYNFTSFTAKNDNPFYQDFSDTLKKRRKEREQKENNENSNDNFYSNPFEKNNNYDPEHEARKKAAYDQFNYQQQQIYMLETIRMIKWILFGFFFIYLYSRMLSRRRDYYESEKYRNYMEPVSAYNGSGINPQYHNYNNRSNQEQYYGKVHPDSNRTYFTRDEVPPYK